MQGCRIIELDQSRDDSQGYVSISILLYIIPPPCISTEVIEDDENNQKGPEFNTAKLTLLSWNEGSEPMPFFNESQSTLQKENI